MDKIEKVSPLAPAKFPNIPKIDGVEFSTAAAGIKYQDRANVMLAILVDILERRDCVFLLNVWQLERRYPLLNPSQ